MIYDHLMKVEYFNKLFMMMMMIMIKRQQYTRDTIVHYECGSVTFSMIKLLKQKAAKVIKSEGLGLRVFHIFTYRKRGLRVLVLISCIGILYMGTWEGE